MWWNLIHLDKMLLKFHKMHKNAKYFSIFIHFVHMWNTFCPHLICILGSFFLFHAVLVSLNNNNGCCIWSMRTKECRKDWPFFIKIFYSFIYSCEYISAKYLMLHVLVIFTMITVWHCRALYIRVFEWTVSQILSNFYLTMFFEFIFSCKNEHNVRFQILP